MPQNCIELLQKCELCILNNLREEPKYVHFKSFKCFVLSFFFFFWRGKSHNIQSITNNAYTVHKHNIKFKVKQAMALSFRVI